MGSRRERDLPEPPLALPPGPVSNGEFVPAPATARDRAIEQATRATVDESARRLGMDRRRFLLTAGGVAASLAAYNLAACSSGSTGAASSTSSSSAATTTAPGGTFTVPSTTDLAACTAGLAPQGDFIFDVHTHHVMPDGPWRQRAPATVGLVEGMLPPDCMAADPIVCADRASYLHSIFLASDTTVALLSDVPASGPDDAAMPFDDAVGTQALAATLAGGGAPRVLVHNVIAPNVGDLQARLDDMTARAASGHVAAFKVYPAWSPHREGGFAVDDPAIGLRVLQHAHDLGVNVFCAHKGLPLVSFDPSHNGPADMVAASRIFPAMQLVVYHGAWDPDHREGPYDPTAARGIDTLLRALDDHGVPPNSNVWADLGTVWRQLLTDPDQAAHAIGKLLARVGVDRVLWGTDAIWYGSPQAQIMAFRAFEISGELQERYGYPALTAAVKAKVFGGNAAALYGLDPEATRCALTADPLDQARPEAAALHADGELASPWTTNGPTSRRDVLRWLATPGTSWSPM